MRSALAQPTGVWTNSFGYDAAKRLTNVTSPAGSFAYTYHASRLTLLDKLSLPNTSYITNTYDSMACLTGPWLKKNDGTTLNSHSYTYNLGNQRTQQVFSAGNTYSYSYDAIGQLKVADSGTASEDRGYLYDAAWNLNYRTNNGSLETFSVDGLNQLTNEPNGAVTYDDNGNLIVKDYESLFYDDENRLAQRVIHYSGTPRVFTNDLDGMVDFTYDGRGRLRERREYYYLLEEGWLLSSQLTYVYDGWRVIQERVGNPTVSYTRGHDLSGSLEGAGGIGGMLGRTAHSGTGGTNLTHAHYHADGNGNITYLVSGSQTLSASYRYDPFGNTISQSGSLADANVYRFSSKEYYHGSSDPWPYFGTYYYGHRWYSPNLHRWPNRDPIDEPGFRLSRRLGSSAKRLISKRLYVFVGNSPIARHDYLGLCPRSCEEICAGVRKEVGSLSRGWQLFLSGGAVVCGDEGKVCPCYIPGPDDPAPGECPEREKCIIDHEKKHIPEVSCKGIEPGKLARYKNEINYELHECSVRAQSLGCQKAAIANASSEKCRQAALNDYDITFEWVMSNCD